MTEFEKWRDEISDYNYENFTQFYSRECHGKTQVELMTDLAWQICQIQECIEGILEDQEG